MSNDTVFLIQAYLRLMSYPLIVFGMLWIVTFRPDWKRRPTSYIFISIAALMIAQFIALTQRLFGDPATALVIADGIVTPTLVLVAVVTWAAIAWLARQWRHYPDTWLA